MASIYRPRYRRVDPKTGKTVVRRRRKFYIEYKDAQGRRRLVPGYTDRKATEAKAASLERRAAREREGLIDPSDEHARKPLGEHLADYHRHLEGKGGTDRHVAETIRQIEAWVRAGKLTRTADVTADSLLRLLASLRGLGRSARTLNAYLIAARGFTRWLARGGRIAPDPLVELSRLNEEADPRHPRRALSDEEFARFLQATYTARGRLTPEGEVLVTYNEALAAVRRAGGPAQSRPPEDLPPPRRGRGGRKGRARLWSWPEIRPVLEHAFGVALPQDVPDPAAGDYRGTSGRDRYWLYLLAAYTGYRRAELASLRPDSFDLASAAPTVTVAARISKRRRTDELPMHPDLVTRLAAWLATKPSDAPLWPGTWREKSAAMIRRDLAVAGISYRDGRGRAFDFHALRGQYATSLARRGVPPQVAQRLMRHSDIRLTMKYYTHLEMDDLRAGVARLPPPPEPPEPPDHGTVHGSGDPQTT